ncbi:MAG: SAM-dependent methyltransferase [Verrucomicrobia bacterium]|nr:MAG: SAM-dependent methyltransferase [Verrucomicrobiota bacterium]
MKFKDHFSGHAVDYAKFRPRYPHELFQYLAAISPRRDLAWDCATGNGQAAIELVRYFRSVVATDASAQQIENAEPHAQISYRIAPAEASGIDSHSADLIIVAQALHWFETDRFFPEAERVLKHDGVLAVSNYIHVKISPAIDSIIGRFYRDTTGPFWPPERALVETDYQSITFPFAELPSRRFEMSKQWNLKELAGYLRTWSAVQRFIASRGIDPVDDLMKELELAWGNPEMPRQVVWPLNLRLFLKRVGVGRSVNP